MKEAIANAGVFNLIIIFVIILLAFFIGSLGYSKAFKVKNIIVNEIEKEKGYTEEVNKTVEDLLGKIGYRMNTGFSSNSCPLVDGGSIVNLGSNYQYCVYKFDDCRTNRNTNTGECKNSKSSIYYRVVTYMYFDVPIINNLIKIPVVGETKSFVTINS